MADNQEHNNTKYKILFEISFLNVSYEVGLDVANTRRLISFFSYALTGVLAGMLANLLFNGAFALSINVLAVLAGIITSFILKSSFTAAVASVLKSTLLSSKSNEKNESVDKKNKDPETRSDYKHLLQKVESGAFLRICYLSSFNSYMFGCK